MNAVAAGFRLQLAVMRRTPAQLLVLLTTPLFSSMFLAIAVHSGNRSILTDAVFAPALMSLWMLAVGLGGGIIGGDRWAGVLELLLVAPTPLLWTVVGRIAATTSLAALSLVESLLVARLGFGVSLTVHHPLLLVGTLLVTLFALVGTAAMFAGLFVLSRAVLLFQNALTYPFYILGGVLVPLSYLPSWLHPVSKLVFLSWAGDLLRDCVDRAGPVDGWPWRLLAVAGLGVAALAAGTVLINRISARVRRTGSAAVA
ncbi:ABC transporter permease [Kutzneria kofuensis]|uniref:ABC-2 type transport system permease protein n=1 Tax=Kutzneria kofuensis TaxID=103725 RepID=A0A7W9KSW5_9PSEU|nr:ABC transporter permease [Kutzneria kofuensis]MBB5898140.1 ABC-2 type transport system permease protein [Kutzneria kofuensis]